MELWHEQALNSAQIVPLEWHFNQYLVLISLLLSVLAAFGGLSILQGAWITKHMNTLPKWRLISSVLLGTGIWVTQYICLLAIDVPINVQFHPILLFASIIMPIISSWLTFGLLQQEQRTLSDTIFAAFIFTSGMVAMLLAARQALELPGEGDIDIRGLLTSLGGTFLLTAISLSLISNRAHQTLRSRVVIGGILGGAIFILPYTALFSLQFHVSGDLVKGNVIHFHNDAIAMTALVMAFFILMILFSLTTLSQIQQDSEVTERLVSREKDIIDSFMDGLLIINSQGDVLSINPVGQTLLGLTNVPISKLRLRAILPSFDINNMVSPTYSGLSDLSHIRTMAMTYQGTQFPCEFTLSRMSVQEGNNALFTLLIRDITEQLSLEQQLRRTHKMESIGQLSAGVAHEINSPAQYVTNNITFLKEGFERLLHTHRLLQPSERDIQDPHTYQNRVISLLNDPELKFIIEEVPQAVEQSLDGMKQVNSIVKAMKSFTNPSEERLQYIDLTEAIRATITVASSQWNGKAVVNTELSDELSSVPCYRDLFNQVVLNLLSNAIHAIEDQKTNRTDFQGVITLKTWRSKHHAVITITDNGVGIPEDIIDRIFDPFFTTREVGQGSGQGLSHVYSTIVDKHNGIINVESQVGVKTTFTIKLPLIINDGHQTMDKVDENLISG
ncbi:ATP-binding protein [Vibrio nitrifigilis]|uniref:histidine kinase n=1 Tax=Vibrio nitrifigilis TaxID=2789781 RepID=A0ABS0GF26_9VIBR|nr:ATP-binding protein [Vibrio nitrifigilis]MBF9001020.1 PAS domain S-box protein [Vibrio nitrifigilis]